MFRTETTPMLPSAPPYLLSVPSSPCISHKPATGTGKTWHTLLTRENHSSHFPRSEMKKEEEIQQVLCSFTVQSQLDYALLLPSLAEDIICYPTASATTSRTEGKKSTKHLQNRDERWRGREPQAGLRPGAPRGTFTW